MTDWKKIVSDAIELGTKKINSLKEDIIGKEIDIKNLITEEDILRAIDDLPDAPVKPVKTVKVKSPGTWSTFNNLYKPEMVGLENIKQDDRVYFTIPAGWSYNDNLEIQYWYMSFPFGGTVDDIVEFYSYSEIDDFSSLK